VDNGAEAGADGEASFDGAAGTQTSLEVGAQSAGDVDLDLGDRIEAMLMVWSQPSVDADLSAEAEGQSGGEIESGSQTSFGAGFQALLGR
jgi:hypothetical protein